MFVHIQAKVSKRFVVNIDDATSAILESVTAAENGCVTVSDAFISINGEQDQLE